MARLAVNRMVIKVGLVLDQAEIRQPVVLKGMEIVAGNIGYPPLVLSVTDAAVGRIHQTAVDAASSGALLGDVGVAALAAIGRGSLPGRVASAALSFKVSVGSKAGKRFLARTSSRKWPRAKRPAADTEQNNPQSRYHHNCRSAA